MTQQALMREFDAFNEKEAMNKRLQKQNQKQQLYDDYLNNVKQYQIQTETQRKLDQEKKEKIRQEQENDLLNYYKRKDKERLDKIYKLINYDLLKQKHFLVKDISALKNIRLDESIRWLFNSMMDYAKYDGEEVNSYINLV